MRILGIESSCDDTSLAVLAVKRGVFRVEKVLTASQTLVHKKTGGVVPEVAAREHAETIFPVLKKIIPDPRHPKIDAIAVTAGPGLVTSLRVGVDVARTLAWLWQVPLLGVNHIEGHICANWLPSKKKSASPKIVFPAVALVVSGGHTELLLMRRFGDYCLLGATRDDAVGEAFDKTAKLLGLGYPGGPEVARLALKGDPSAINLPRPMIKSADFDFSFSGLKTAVRDVVEGGVGANRRVRPGQGMPLRDVQNICASFEEAVVDVLVAKTVAAARAHKAKTVLLGGGVAANLRLRAALRKSLRGVRYVEPDLSWTTDNAAMIAAAGYFSWRDKRLADPLTINPDPNCELGR